MERAQRKVRSGKVVSDKMDKTVVVSVEITESHPIYKKSITRTKNYKAHDENNEARIGDTVTIMETRLLSKDKCWRVVEITQRSIAL
ncbi:MULTISPECIES: 30S ribosomal protein S17 [Desulfosporosinus]|uniref:Small ribosomal subunit protein uS17 n=2 Tax=Desulfosporosinus TaxID=79206 RepID=A0A1M6CN58_9FIRM|nr:MULTISPECIES: 30S ribosomal protein S17 [Desulfosporosinus]MDA8220704.1 30S ribosomal protein S17 [Desulfitobacterium hafniense]MCO1602660.1 30S ribosomal protein S17 [Desulfosporosinus nitroreducens]MCO5388168.1 30S ribosomal protein S17 [Desulfosporosinus sp.]MDO0823633.1 30S ribosomal protein S17 [Desulfosporosinus nitroreducens]SHI62389.1 small subunit ribosomal protein S17 [Desulfosporosinus lacus DSM 15449]